MLFIAFTAYHITSERVHSVVSISMQSVDCMATLGQAHGATGARSFVIRISRLHASEHIHGMYDVTSGCSIAATLSIAVNSEIGRWAFEMCA